MAMDRRSPLGFPHPMRAQVRSVLPVVALVLVALLGQAGTLEPLASSRRLACGFGGTGDARHHGSSSAGLCLHISGHPCLFLAVCFGPPRSSLSLSDFHTLIFFALDGRFRLFTYLRSLNIRFIARQKFQVRLSAVTAAPSPWTVGPRIGGFGRISNECSTIVWLITTFFQL